MSFWNKYPGLSNDIKEVEKYIKRRVVSRKLVVNEIVNDLINAGGKRIRPAFVIISGKLGSAFSREEIIPLAASIELIHTATLVHDDIIDESDYRRGNKSIYAKWGRDMALYTGDYLFTQAFMILSNKTQYNQIDYVARAMKTICEGEIDQYEQKNVATLDEFLYFKKIYRKTAVLFALSGAIGGIQSKCIRSNLNAMITFAQHFGMAFQIKDDLLDYTSSVKSIGKPIGNDLRQGNITYPIIVAMKNNNIKSQITSLLNNFSENPKSVNEQIINHTIENIKNTDCIERTIKVLKRFSNKAIECAKLIDDIEIKNILIDLCEAILFM